MDVTGDKGRIKKHGRYRVTKREVQELLDRKLRELIVGELEKRDSRKAGPSYAERAFAEIMKCNGIAYDGTAEEGVEEITYGELEREVKHELRKRMGPWLEQEISRLQKRLGK
jgi:hypothetical protein